VLLVVHLAFRDDSAGPADPGVTLSALDLGAAAVVFRDGHFAFDIRTRLGTVLKEKCRQFGSHVFVSLFDVRNLIGNLVLVEVDSVQRAPLERVRALLAVKAKQELAVLAAACVFGPLDVSETAAAGQRTPS
jgi:hypothetical protein